MTHTPAPIELTRGALRLALRPDLGGCIAGLWHDGLPVLRSTEPAVPEPAPATAAFLADPLPLAVGVLMHRHALTRAQAWQRLQRLAQEQQLSLAEQAQRLLAAVEELPRTAA